MKSLQDQKPNVRNQPSEERQHPRLKVRVPVRFWWGLGSKRPDYKHGHTENISAEGMFLRCFGLDMEFVRRLIHDESELRLRIRLKEGEDPLHTVGRILRAVKSNDDMLLAVRFTNIDSDERDRIHEFMLPHYTSRSR